MTPLRSVCVFCGSRAGADPAFARDAQALGLGIAQHGWRLVYGAGDVGLMGEVARAALGAGANSMGVIPVHLMGAERGKRDLGQLVITQDMHERKKVMFMNSDAIIVLPGGAGSLDEFFEVLTWRQIGLHEKPIYLLNTNGYWTPLMSLLNHVVQNGFAQDEMLDCVTEVATVPDALTKIRDYFAQSKV